MWIALGDKAPALAAATAGISLEVRSFATHSDMGLFSRYRSRHATPAFREAQTDRALQSNAVDGSDVGSLAFSAQLWWKFSRIWLLLIGVVTVLWSWLMLTQNSEHFRTLSQRASQDQE